MPVDCLTPMDDRFERLYLQVREREGRVLPDALVRKLPSTPQGHPQAREWRLRRNSFERYATYLRRRGPGAGFRLLDVGCGNGWMSRLLAETAAHEVLGLDVNLHELEQADRLFARQGLRFAYGNVFDAALPEGHFHQIVLAASAQYFPDFTALIGRLRALLRPDGEIHVFDTPFYGSQTARDAARQRTHTYFNALGVNGAFEYYHHHLRAEATALRGVDLNASRWLLRRLGSDGPFPWFRFKSML